MIVLVSSSHPNYNQQLPGSKQVLANYNPCAESVLYDLGALSKLASTVVNQATLLCLYLPFCSQHLSPSEQLCCVSAE